MEDVAHDQYVGAGELIGEEVPGKEPQAVAQPGVGDEAIENWLELGEVEAAAAQVAVSQRDLHWNAALGAADVDKRLIAIPGKSGRQCVRDPSADPRHRLGELLQF